MYLDFYQLNLKPFQISTDPRFLWLGEKHREALAVLKYGILDNKGFLLLTGDVGTGKTTLLNALVESLGVDVLVAMVADPGLSKMEFFNFVADSFGMKKRFRSKGEFLIYLKNYLIEVNRQNKQALLIIDECQRLNQPLLEEIRLLSNIEMTNTKLINIFFVGQNEFNDIILSHHNRAIRQRITINYNITALSEAETQAYICFRLSIAGADDTIFTSGAIDEVYKFSDGYPRLINIICDQALLTGFVKEKKQIDEKIVVECADELKIKRVGFIKDSEAIPESRIALQAKSLLAALRKRLPLIQPQLLVLLVVLIILSGLVITVIFNRHPSDMENPSSAVDVRETSGNTTDRNDSDLAKNDIGDGSGAAERVAASMVLPNSQGNEYFNHSPMAIDSTTEETIGDGTLDAKQSDTSLTSPIGEDAERRISLGDIQEKFGIYPEVYFELNSNKLDESGYQLLGVISRFCLQNPETILVLRGYTDKSGVRAYNLILAEFRADMVKTYLVGRGVEDKAITTLGIGPGEEGPGGTKVPYYEGKRRKVVIELISPIG